jgi:hypothetical protein
MSAAQVHAIERLADFKSALICFAERARDAMSGNAMEIRRSGDWLEGQLGLWKAEQRRAEEVVVKARNELSRKKMMRIGDRPPDTTEEEKALRKAQARLAFIEERRESTVSWIRQLPDAVEEYDGQARPFQDLIECEVARMIAFLEQKIAALQEYRRVEATGETS